MGADAGTPTKQHTRAERLRQYAADRDSAAQCVAAMGEVVRGREARRWDEPEPPEVVFAATTVAGRGLPAGVWAALRRDDTEAAVEAMLTVSQSAFLVAAHEEMGEGYRLQTVEETRPLPEADLLVGQLAAMLGIPADVLAVVAQWGPHDPRAAAEIGDLLDRRFGAPLATPASEPPASATHPAAVVTAAPAPGAGLVMSVAETADVLQLTSAQTAVLATLVRRVGVTISA